MPPAKRQKVSDDDELASQHDDDALLEEDSAEEYSSSEGDSGSDGEDNSPDTEDEIEVAKRMKSKKTLKRKRRATEPSHFGATLQSLLNTDTPSALPLSLKPGVARKRNDEQMESKARKVLQVEKKDKEDKRRMRDVIGGWGGESERVLRKVAQRGVVKLFNVIQQSQTAASSAVGKPKAIRGTPKLPLPAPSLNNISKHKGKGKEFTSSKASGAVVDKDDFFHMIRSGGVVSKI